MALTFSHTLAGSQHVFIDPSRSKVWFSDECSCLLNAIDRNPHGEITTVTILLSDGRRHKFGVTRFIKDDPP